MFILRREERGRIIHIVRIFVIKGRHEARPRQKSTVLGRAEEVLGITTGLFTKWTGLWSLGRRPWLGRRLGQRARRWLSEPQRCSAEDFGVGGTMNFLEKGIQSLGNFGFQGS